MKPWKMFLIPLLIVLAIGGIYLFVVFKHRQDPGTAARNAAADEPKKDDLVVMRAFFPQHFDDTLRLQNTTVWMKNGYTITYFPYTAGQVQWTKPVGVIPSVQRMDVKKIIKAAAPAKVDDGIEHGTRQAMAVFVIPGNKQEYATPIGYMEGSEEAYYTDLLFFYDDPHAIYDYWPHDVWASIDAHQVRQGMSEAETRLALGQKSQSSPGKEGNRTVTYNQDGKKWIVTFVNDKATDIKAG